MFGLLLVGCEKFSQEAKELSKTNFNGNVTIEAAMNEIAGLNGKVDYFMPKEQPENTNYRYLGVTITRDRQSAEYIILVDKAKNGSQASSITFGNHKMIFNNKGNADSSMDTLIQFYTWAGQSEREIRDLLYSMAFAGIFPEVVPISQ